MSNTIRRPRRRPRVKSVNFRALWWLVHREVCFLVLHHRTAQYQGLGARASVRRVRRDRLTFFVGDELRRHPGWRYYP